MKQNTFYIISIAFTAAIGGFLLGFDGSVISGAIPFYKSVFGLEDGSFLLGFSVSCILWGSIIGNLIAGPLSDKIGRKPSLILAALLFVITGVMSAFASNIWVFIIGRIIGGFGVGIALLVAPVYIGEIAPAKDRGWLVSFNQLLIVIGLFTAYFTNYYILKLVDDPQTNWRWMLGIEIVPAILYFLGVLFIPESPRWLIMTGKEAKGIETLAKVGGVEYAQNEANEIKKNLGVNKEESLSTQASYFFSKKMRLIMIISFGLGILQQFSGINAILYYAPMVFESAGGGRDAAFLQAVVLGLVFLVMTVVSMFLIDRIGRKPLLYLGVGLMALSLTFTGLLFKNAIYVVDSKQITASANTILEADLWAEAKRSNSALMNYDSIAMDNLKASFIKKNELISTVSLDIPSVLPLIENKNNFISKMKNISGNTFSDELAFYKGIDDTLAGSDLKADSYKPSLLKDGIKINSLWVLISILGFIAGFSISLGPVMWAMFSEIFPNRIRGFAISAAGTINAISSFLVATFFPIQLAKLGSANTYFIYAGFMFFCLWFTWKYIVETKGKSLEELEIELTK
jgi:MFS transporter, SP family, arabinose:H+ symporter